MNLDVRLPIGGMFSIIGLIMTVYGLATSGNEMYARSLSMNVNLEWGLVLLVFGAIMLFLGWRGYQRDKANPPPASGGGEAPRGH
jgi:hypothetical protein